MEITKKQWMIIGVVIAIIAVWYFFLRKKKAPESNYRRTPPYKRPLFGTVTGVGTSTATGNMIDPGPTGTGKRNTVRH